MPLKFIRQDITKIDVDAVVNPTNNAMIGGGNGVDMAICNAEGDAYFKKCVLLGGCETGKAKYVEADNIKAEYIINTVPPKWLGGGYNEAQFLASCYRESLAVANKLNCWSVAIPLMATGHNGYPKREAMDIAIKEINDFLVENDMDVYLVVYDKESFELSQDVVGEVEQYISDNFVKFKLNKRNRFSYEPSPFEPAYEDEICRACAPIVREPISKSNKPFSERSLIGYVNAVGQSFTSLLFEFIDRSGMKDSECYKKANVSKSTFSKIRCVDNYVPKKNTILALAVALELSLVDTERLLNTVGYTLSHSNIGDIIVEYFIIKKRYNVFELNEYLYNYDQPLLGSV